MRQFRALAGLTILLAVGTPAFAQQTRMVPVDGRAMRVQVAGFEQLGKVPTVIFESGGGGPSIAVWGPIVADIAKAAPVVAYDRAANAGPESGNGKLLVPQRYVNPESSGLKIDVKAGEENTPTLKLTTP